MGNELKDVAGYEIIHGLAKKTSDPNLKILDNAVSGYQPDILIDQQVKELNRGKSPKTQESDLEQN